MSWFKYAVATIAAVLLLFSAPVYAYEIQGNCVVEENALYKISQCPHTLTDVDNFANLTVKNKDNQARAIDLAFGFDTSVIKPTAAWVWNINAPHYTPVWGNATYSKTCQYTFGYNSSNQTFWCNYQNGTQDFVHRYNFGYPANKTGVWFEWEVVDWLIDYYPDWVEVSGAFQTTQWQGKTWYYRQNINFAAGEEKTLRVRVLVAPDKSGKYDLFAKLSSDSFQEAFDYNRFVWLDPWFSKTLP